jgi:hypothetical protein
MPTARLTSVEHLQAASLNLSISSSDLRIDSRGVFLLADAKWLYRAVCRYCENYNLDISHARFASALFAKRDAIIRFRSFIFLVLF